ncbi:Coiled-coil domain-containing protein 162 [Acipenser ruthenus]|uniref:Coiled-coil domain-containing protein 162 n=1 Tax=Acipenser ruthenus TaxID=7906 RepID=A0A444U0J2_ACIRT|nr:Coiled-coil domain-containing protein 162 [Acipenser ruthenus]
MFEMAEDYKISSTEKLQLMEKELAVQLVELKTEIEENGVLQGTPARSYSSVPIPKDISYFRKERELILRKGLQVAEARPVAAQADVMERELESCLRQEYTPESLPLLLHQFYTDRISQLVQFKYLCMLRWRRFCQHSGIIEQLYPLYKKQLEYIMKEYDDTVQRARRLSVARESFLTEKGTPVNAVTQEDLVIYLQWLVCHLQSVKTIHNYLRITAKHDPWQQKMITKLKQDRSVDELLHLHSKFFQVSDPDRLMEALKEHAATVFEPEPIQPLSVTSHPTGQHTNQIWKRIYSSPDLFQAPIPEESSQPESNEQESESVNQSKRPGSQKKKKEEGYCYMDTMQLLGLDEGKEENIKDPVMMRGAYLSFLYLRHLRIRELQRICLGFLNYFRSVERTLTFSIAGLSLDGMKLTKTAEDSCWVNAARGGSGTAGGLGSHQYLHNTPADYKVHSAEFMEFPEVENYDDFYTTEDSYIHTQDQRGVYIMYDEAVKDLQELENVLLLVASQYIEKDKGHKANRQSHSSACLQAPGTNLNFWAHVDVDRFAVLLELWTCEVAFLKNKQQLLDCYFEAYQHVLDHEERFALAQVITDIMHKRPRLEISSQYFVTAYEEECVCLQYHQQLIRDILNKQLLDCYFEAYQHVLDHEERFALAQVITDIMHKRPRLEISSQYFVTAYEEECVCLQYHQQLIRDILNKQIDEQRQYVQRVWRDGQKGNVYEFGLPPNYTPKQLIAINNNSSALRNVFLLEFHPSLGLASRIPQALNQAYSELCQLRRPQSVQESVALEKQLLQLAVEKWQALEPPGASYSTPVQKDLFSGIFFEDPFFVRDVGFSALEFAEEGEKKQGREKQAFIVETFSRLLELITLRHRLIESASETSQLAQLYRTFSAEMGFNEFHLYLRPVQFEFAAHREKADQPPPVFITALLEDDSQVDRYTPSSLLLGIQEIDENQIGKFSFRTQEAVLQLLSTSGIENMQVVLACQVTQKNALIGAVKQASLCHQAQQLSQKVDDTQVQRGSAGSWSRGSSATGPNSLAAKELESQFTAPGISSISARPKLGAGARRRPPEAFVSIQLEKAGPRDVMLNTFISKKQAMGTIMKSPEEAQKVKRGLILEFCQKFCHRMCQYSLRGQIIEYYNSLAALLEDIPSIRDTYFMLGQPHERKGERDSEEGLNSDPRCFQRRPRCLLSGDGESFLNLWFIPHFSEVLIMFKSLEENTCHRSLQQTLQIVGALHDIVSYLVSFARLGNYSAISRSRKPKQLTADWGGTEGIGAELQGIQKQIDDLCDPASPQEVGKLLHLRRDVLFLQFDTGVRHLIREAFLAAGNKEAYQTVTDNMYHALPALSTSLVSSVCSSQITVPQPLDPISVRLCLSGLNDRNRNVANGEILGVSLLMEDVLQSSQDMINFSLQGWEEDNNSKVTEMQLAISGVAELEDQLSPVEGKVSSFQALLQDHIEVYTLLRAFLVLWKQLEVFKAEWGRQRLCVEDINTVSLYKQFSKIYSGVAELEDQLSPVEGKVSSFQALLQDHIEVYTLLRAFLVLWKQLEVFKAEWGRQRLCVEDINTVSLYKQFSKIYRVEILYPTMKVIARQLGKEDKFEGLVSDTQPILLPKGASEVETKTHQLHKLLESLEGHMIHAVQKKILKELTLVISERARQDTGLPAELWKHPVMKESFSAVRPQIVESFLQTLLERCEENKDKLTFTKDHLEACLTSLACDVMARERSNFETYSMFYENILQQEHQLLYQKEQDLKTLEESKTQCEGLEGQTADLSHEMIVEITALRAKLSNLEEEKQSLREEVRKEVQHEYEELVRSMFVACYHLQVKLDEYHVRMNQDVSDLVTEVRREGVENIIKLKKKYGSTKDDEALKGTLARQEELQALRGENSRLEGLLCKLKSLGCWRQTVKQGQLRKQLRQHQQEAVLHKKECLAVKMVAEEEEILLQQELEAVRQALSKCQKEYMTIKKQLGKQRQLLKESEHRAAEETRSRQHLDSMKAANLWRLLEDVEEKEKQLQVLTGELENNSKTTQLQNQKTDKEIRQVKSQLSLERSLKQDAFQRVDELQSQVYDIEATLSQRNSSAGVIKKPLMSRRASSITSIRPGSASWNLLSTHSAFVLSRDYQQPSPTLDRKAVNSIGTTGKDTRLQRPKTVPIRLRNKVAEALLPDLEEVNPHRLITQLQDLRLSKK